MVLLILICFLTMSAVNAANQTAEQTFSDLQTLIDDADEKSSIELDCDYSYDGKDDNTISVYKELTINGNNHVLDGKGKIGIMEISSKVTINNVIFKNGESENGGAIYAYEVIINNSEFESNHGSYMGGAIFISGISTLKNGNTNGKETLFSDAAVINNCKFIENNAVYGGAIYATNGIIENCKFTNNEAEYGGAINAEDAVIKNSEFIANYAYNDGGAIFATNSIISSSSFSNNVAGSYGGAVYSDRSLLDGCKFTSNRADLGGGVTAFSSKISNCEFYSNTAKEEGGAIYSFYNLLVNNIFKDNKAQRGEAIYGVDTIIKDCIFKNNTNLLIDESKPSYTGLSINDYDWDCYQESGLDTSEGSYTHHDLDKSLNSISKESATGNPLALLLISLLIPVINFKKFKR